MPPSAEEAAAEAQPDGRASFAEGSASEQAPFGENSEEVEAMLRELRTLGAPRASGTRKQPPPQGPAASPRSVPLKAFDPFEEEDDEPVEDTSVDARFVERSGMVCVMGVPNAGKSSLVNALVGSKVSIVSPKPQTTRQKVLGLALLSPRPGMPPTTQACFIDTAGIVVLGAGEKDVLGSGPRRKQRKKSEFSQNKMHKAMVKTAWRSIKQADAVWWVLDATKCHNYGDFLPPQATLDGFAVAPMIRDSWWAHWELDEELAFLRRIRRMKRKVHVVLNKVDILTAKGVDIDEFAMTMKDRLSEDLGSNEEGEELLQAVWPTSVAHDPDSLVPMKKWLCENMPIRSEPLFPLAVVSDTPARVVASETTREKLFAKLRGEVPYATAVVNAVWREMSNGKLVLGQKVIVKNPFQARVVRRILREISTDAEIEISNLVNFGQPVDLHFRVEVDPDWQEDEKYYNDVIGLLTGETLEYKK